MMATQHKAKATSAITSAERQRSVQKWRISTKYPYLSCKLQSHTAAGEDPKPHSKTLAEERTCWTKASHRSESQRIRPCFSAWVSDVLGKKSSSTSKGSDNTMCWATVVGALWTTFQYQIKNQIKNHKCWRAKSRAELAHFTYAPYSCPEHWPYLGLNASVACTSHKALIGFCEFWNLVFSCFLWHPKRKAAFGSKDTESHSRVKSQPDGNGRHGSAQSNVHDQNCWRGKVCAELAQFSWGKVWSGRLMPDMNIERIWEDLRGIELSRAK